MERFEIIVSTDELLGLLALAVLDGEPEGATDELAATAGMVMREGLEARLRDVGLPWGPTREQVLEYRNTKGQRPSAPGAGASRPSVSTDGADGTGTPLARFGWRLQSIWESERVRIGAAVALGIVTLVLLLGGYVAKWSWTGFSSNNQLWDWLHLLLLPVAFGTLPLWLRFSEHMSTIRKVAFLTVLVAFVGFVIAGYLVPIRWTGFSGNTLWDWLTLIVLPVTLVTIRAWPASPREVGGVHLGVFTALAAAWIVTLIGGYAATWKWTGYPGNTLWDWLQLLLAPLVITTVVVPAAVRWVSGDAARRAREAAAQREREASPSRAS